jgi:subtilisin family serine protease
MNDQSAHTHHDHGSSAHGQNQVYQKDSFLSRLWKCLTGLQNEKHPVQYFLPGKVILYVDHSTRLTPTKLSELIRPKLASLAEGQLKDPDPKRIITFPFGKNPRMKFSLVPVDVTSDQPDDLVNLLVNLDRKLKGKTAKDSSDVSIRAVSPDWLIGSATHGKPHPPSPGSWPLEAESADQAIQFRGPQGVITVANGQQAGIHVAILDTAPESHDLEEAYQKWGGPDNLFSRLFAPGTGKLHVHRGINTDIELMDCSPVGNRYLMSDHGTFIAGIINEIAPEATLHLIRVFTPYGSASTVTIAQGLLQVLEDPEIGRPLVVNCSFGLSIDEGPDFPVQLRGMNTSLQEIFKSITDTNGIAVVAAAGNDGDRNFSRYPAIYENVIAVGALDKTLIPATYTNLSGKPPDLGYMAFGGEPGEGQGVRGIYINEFPVYAEGCLSYLWRKLTGKGLDGWKGPGHLPPIPPDLTLDRFQYRPNTTGRAWWAGTSFAAPFITGFLAALWSGPLRGTVLNFASAQAELDKHMNSRTSEGEKVIYVEQGSP